MSSARSRRVHVLRSFLLAPALLGGLLLLLQPEAGAGPAGLSPQAAREALERGEGPLYIVSSYPRAGSPVVPEVEVLSVGAGESLVSGPLDSIRLLSVLGYKIRRVPSPGLPPVPAPEAPAGAVAYDERIRSIIDQVTTAGIVSMLNGLSGETQVEIGGMPQYLDSRYSPSPFCRTAEQYAFETLQAAGLAAAYEPFFGGTLYGVFASADGLEGWLGGTGGTVLHTENGGSTWEAQPFGVTTECWDVNMAAPDTLWAVGDAGMIRRSVNGGGSWSAQTSGTSNYLHRTWFLNASEGWVVGDLGTIRRTTNGGANWTAQVSGTSQRLYCVQFIGNADTGWVCGRNGTIRRTVNRGASWAAQTSGTTERLYDLCFTDRNNGWAVGWNGKIVHTSNGGANWAAQTAGTAAYLYAVDFVTPTEGWIAGWNGTILHTVDGGANWEPQESGTSADFYSMDFSDALHGWAAGAGVLVRTSDGGATWEPQTGALPGSWRNVVATHPGVTRAGREILLTAHLDDTSGNPSVDAPGADDNGSGSVAVLRGAQILSGLDFEKTIKFILFTGEEQGLVGSGVYASNAAARGDTIDAVVNFDMIGYEGNNVDVFEAHAGTDPASGAVADAFIDVNATYGLNLVLEKITAGATTASDHSSFWDVGYPAILGIEDFQDFTPYYHTVNDRVPTIDQSYFTRATQAAVATAAVLAGLSASAVDVPDAAAPAPPIALLPPSPSPAQGAATIRFSLGAPSDVRVQLFHPSGRWIRDLRGGCFGAGPGGLAWDGRDARGRPVPSGIVLYRVIAGNAQAAGRIVVIR